jgi:AcrR family transcriptional regulator
MPGNQSKSRGPGRGPQKRGERTRLAILEATLRLIARRGLGSVTFRDVAEAAGVSLGVTTYHFASRTELLSAAFALHLEQTDAQGVAFSRAFGPSEAAKSPSLEALTDAVVALLRRFVVDERDSFIASHELTLELSRDSDLASRIQGALSNHRKEVSAMVARVGSPEPELDGEILSAALEGLALKWLSQPNDPDFEAHLRRMVRHLMKKFSLVDSKAPTTEDVDTD